MIKKHIIFLIIGVTFLSSCTDLNNQNKRKEIRSMDKESYKELFGSAQVVIDSLEHQRVQVFDKDSNILCENRNLISNTFNEFLIDVALKNSAKGFSVLVNEISKKPTYSYYVSFSEDKNLQDIYLDTIINVITNYEISEPEFAYLQTGVLVTKEDFGNISFCQFDINSKKIIGLTLIEKNNLEEEKSAFKRNYEKAINAHEKGNDTLLKTFFSNQKLARLLYKVPIYLETVAIYNNIGFYLHKIGENENAIFILHKIIEANESRVVAYLNLADVYWDHKQWSKAKSTYNNYVDLMKKQAKELNKIPKRVYDRLSSVKLK